MKCGTVKYVDKFPKEINLEQKDLQQLDVDLTGCVDFFLADTLLVAKYVDSDCFWTVFSLKDLSLKERLLEKGHGQNEFLYIPGSESVSVSDTSLTCNLYSSDNGFFRCNLKRSVDGHRLYMDEIKPGIGLDNVVYINALNDSAFFIVRYGGLGFRRELLGNGRCSTVQGIGNLNKLQATEDINTLSFVTAINKPRGIVAEAMLRLNQINLYAIADSGYVNKTICIGNELTDVAKVDKMSKRKRKWTFAKIKQYSDYFIALYHNARESYLYDGDGVSHLLVFDCNGNPVAKIKIPFIASSFDISSTGDFYIFDNYGKKEALYKYKNIMSI